jgi:hypothetical protein
MKDEPEGLGMFNLRHTLLGLEKECGLTPQDASPYN